MKTITISDDVYEKLVKLKKNRSFSDIIDDLIRGCVSKRIDMLIESAKPTGREDELEEVVRSVREGLKIRT